MALSILLPTVGGDENTWGTKTNNALTTILNGVNGTSGTVAPNLSTLTINSVNVTATAAELNKLAGTPAGLTNTELGYVDGVTSGIQTQLDAKQATISGGASTIASSNLTANRALISNGSGKVAVSSTITTTELGYLNGVSSNIQTQFNNIATANDATITISAGTGLTTGGAFTTNQGTNETITLNLTGDQRLAAATDVYVGNSDEHIHFNDGSQHIEFMTGGAEEMRLENDGDLHVDGNITAYSTTVSDQRLKHDIQKIDGALDKVSQLSGYTFSYNKDGKRSAGVIAQEVEKVLPSAVENKSLVFHGEEGIEYKTVQYDQLHGLLIEAIKELKAEIEELKNGSTG